MSRVLVPETMLKFKCNQRGCCCKGWGIPFAPEDLGRLLMGFEPAQREAILEGAQADIDSEGQLLYVRLRTEGPERACQFLAPQGQCGVHAERGPEILPHLCRAFPTFAHQAGDQLELHYDAVCPEVLERIDASDASFRLVEVDTEPGTELHVRSQRPLSLPQIVIGEQQINLDELHLMRGRMLQALSDSQGPALHKLAHIANAFLRVLGGQPVAQFSVDPEDPVQPFEAFFEQCMTIHDGQILARLFRDYAPFVHAISVEGADWQGLGAHLGYSAQWRAHLDPLRPDLQPLLNRYLSHRVFSAFDRSPSANRLSFTYGTINHCLAVAFRYAVGLSSWLGRPIDRQLMKVALGASEYAFRIFRVPQWSMPWFGLESVRPEEQPAPPAPAGD